MPLSHAGDTVLGPFFPQPLVHVKSDVVNIMNVLCNVNICGCLQIIRMTQSKTEEK